MTPLEFKKKQKAREPTKYLKQSVKDIIDKCQTSLEESVTTSLFRGGVRLPSIHLYGTPFNNYSDYSKSNVVYLKNEVKKHFKEQEWIAETNVCSFQEILTVTLFPRTFFRSVLEKLNFYN